MNTQNVPSAIHGKAIDLACEDDRLWFEQNPGRRHRLRSAMAFENNGPVQLLPEGMTWKVLVTQIERGMRLRLLMALPVDVDGNDDKQLAELFKKAAPPEAKRLLSSALKRKGKTP